MRKHAVPVCIFLLLIAFSPAALAQDSDQDFQQDAQNDTPDLSVFYDALSPYGPWIYTPEFGWVWQPSGVAADWQPYTYGRWVWTEEYGWYWDSDYEWGWAPFHYGRWTFMDDYGWVWVPGTVWAPAWVDWRYSTDYIGWYPLPPTYVVIYNRWYPCDCAPHRWIFIKPSDFGRDDQNHRYIPSFRIDEAIRSTSESHKYIPAKGGHAYIAGPPLDLLENETGRVFKPGEIQEAATPARSVSRPGFGLKIPVYMPGFSVSAQVMLPKKSISKLQEPARPLAAPSQQIKGLKATPGAVYQPGTPRTGYGQQQQKPPKSAPQASPPRTVKPNDYDFPPTSSEQSYRTYHPAGLAPSGTAKPSAQPQGDGADDDLNVKKSKKTAPAATVKPGTVKTGQ